MVQTARSLFLRIYIPSANYRASFFLSLFSISFLINILSLFQVKTDTKKKDTKENFNHSLVFYSISILWLSVDYQSHLYNALILRSANFYQWQHKMDRLFDIFLSFFSKHKMKWTKKYHLWISFCTFKPSTLGWLKSFCQKTALTVGFHAWINKKWRHQLSATKQPQFESFTKAMLP